MKHTNDINFISFRFGCCSCEFSNLELCNAHHLDEYFLLVNYDAVNTVVPYYQEPEKTTILNR